MMESKHHPTAAPEPKQTGMPKNWRGAAGTRSEAEVAAGGWRRTDADVLASQRFFLLLFFFNDTPLPQARSIRGMEISRQ
jgi:hypothetical protein